MCHEVLQAQRFAMIRVFEDFAFNNHWKNRREMRACVRASVRALRGGRKRGGRGFLLPRGLEDALLLLEASHTNRLMVDRNAGRRRHLATRNREADGAWNIVSPHKTVSVSPPQLLQPDQASTRLRSPSLLFALLSVSKSPCPTPYHISSNHQACLLAVF